MSRRALLGLPPDTSVRGGLSYTDTSRVATVRALVGRTRLVAVACGLVLPLATFAGPGAASSQSRPLTTGAAARIADTVSVGCSGGETGGGSGNTLTRDGQLFTYRQLNFRRESITHTLLRHDATAAASVFEALARSRFRTLRVNHVGNMTCHLALQDSAGRHVVTWLMRQPPAELEPVLAALRLAFGDDRRMWP